MDAAATVDSKAAAIDRDMLADLKDIVMLL
jgi:hypothetical protein